MNQPVRTPRPAHERACAARLLGAGMLLSVLLSACTSPPTEPRQPSAGIRSSAATNAKAYRQDAARHLYTQQKDRVYKGRLPPMLYAVGVLNVDIDRQGQIQALKWTRVPRHAPEVVAEIERMVRAAEPFPAPSQLGNVTYTDVWLWDRSGRFQLDTLTEGQD
jgi:periplasmic protein TonB